MNPTAIKSKFKLLSMLIIDITRQLMNPPKKKKNQISTFRNSHVASSRFCDIFGTFNCCGIGLGSISIRIAFSISGFKSLDR